MRSQRQRDRVATAFVLGAVLVLGTTALQNGSALASPESIGTVSQRSGAGTVTDPYAYTVTVPDTDCIKIKDVGGFEQRSIDPGVEGAYYLIVIESNCVDGGGRTADPTTLVAGLGGVTAPGVSIFKDFNTNPVSSISFASGATYPTPFQFTAGGSFRPGIGLGGFPGGTLVWVIGSDPVSPGAPALEQAPDSTVSSVAMAVAQAAAVGVEGTSSAVLIRNDEVVPVVSRVLPSVGPRGGVALDAEGLRATVASASGARVETGVVVSPSGDLEVSVVSGLVPGAVVEVWVNSSPRLVAAARVPDDHAEGDSLTLTVPLGAPLDGGEPIEAGAHTLQVRMYTNAGFEVLATGITVGGVVPAGVPAGGGPVGPDGVLFVLLGAAGLVGLAVRRTVVSG